MTNYLRFANEAAFQDAALAAGLRTEEGTYVQYTHDHAMDIVGILYNNDAIIDPETGEITSPATPMEGWQINYIGTLPEGWDQYLAAPLHPRRVFA